VGNISKSNCILLCVEQAVVYSETEVASSTGAWGLENALYAGSPDKRVRHGGKHVIDACRVEFVVNAHGDLYLVSNA
jgi:hypothetical protein